MMSQHNDVSARLLAQENISIVRAAVSTASFDVKNRVLTIPQWKDMTPQIEDMLQCHEVGHALYTSATDWSAAIDSFAATHPTAVNTLRGYMNVIEDARIEAKIKSEYPGIGKSFYSGYRALHERDFFSIADRDINDFVLIDRINLYYKIGFLQPIKFSDAERVFLRRIDSAETIQEVAALAIEIYEFSAQQIDESATDIDQDDVAGDGDTNDLTDDTDFEDEEEFDDSEDSADTTDTGPTTGTDDLRATTAENFAKKLDELSDITTEYRYYNVEPLLYDPVIDYKPILADIKKLESGWTEHYIEKTKCNFSKFYREIVRSVDYLVKEFEMKKSADSFARTTISKSGSIDLNKVFKYKLDPDIFRKISVVPHGQKHAMVFLLDWSGSMRGNIEATIRQTISLALFCRKTNIPFEVFAFTTGYTSPYDARKRFIAATNKIINSGNTPTLFSDSSLNLLNIFSSRMSAAEFNTAARYFSEYKIWMSVEKYSLEATPLNDALIYMLDYLPAFMRRHAVQKMSLITLTDGASDALCVLSEGGFKSSIRTREYRSELNINVNLKNFIRDEQTKKTYAITDSGGKQTAALLSMIQDRLGIKSIGFYVSGKTGRSIYGFVAEVCSRRPTKTEVDRIRSNIRTRGYHSLRGLGRDEFFVIYAESLSSSDEALEITETASAKVIAKKFSKQLSGRKLNRNLLEKFVSTIA